MQCPKCRADVPEWHFYCSNCNALVSDARARAEKDGTGVVERTGQKVVKLLFAIFIGGLIVLMARAVQWRDLAKLVSGDAARAAAVPASKKDQAGAAKPEKNALAKSNLPAESAEKPKRSPQLPAPQEKIAMAAQPTATGIAVSLEAPRVKAKSAPVLPPASNGQIALQATSGPKIIPPTSAAQKTEFRSTSIAKGQQQTVKIGFVEISSNTPARIYVDGQFSGRTPRVINLKAGDHQIRLIAEGYEDWARNVNLKTLEQMGIKAAMEKKLGSSLDH